MRFPFTGVIPVDKPAGCSSRQVVDVVGRAVAMKAVGHAGTLDPLARGVVVVCVGHATKLVDFLHDLPKHYTATFLLGRASPSDDLETPVVEELDPVRPDLATIAAAMEGFRGEILQRPCDYSAVHVGGQRAYRLARKGREIALSEKRVRIERLEILSYEWPRLTVEVICSSGTFIRAIGRDLAGSLGTTAVMESLVRTAVGGFVITAAVPLAEVDVGTAGAALLPAARAVTHLERITLDGDLLARAVRGGLLELPADAAAAVAAFGADGVLVGILRRHESGGHRLRPNFLGVG